MDRESRDRNQSRGLPPTEATKARRPSGDTAIGRSTDFSGPRPLSPGPHLGQPKIKQLRAGFGEHDVARLGYYAVEARIEGAIHLTHTSGAEEREDLVRSETGAGSEGHYR